jgi:hypothetical protein
MCDEHLFSTNLSKCAMLYFSYISILTNGYTVASEMKVVRLITRKWVCWNTYDNSLDGYKKMDQMY